MKRNIDLSFIHNVLDYSEFELPSKGFLYHNTDISEGICHVRPMSANEEKLIGKINNINNYSILNTIITNCVKEKNWDVDELTLDDRFALLCFIRNITYGPKYNIITECPLCEAQELKIEINLDDFDITFLEEEPKEPFDIILPTTKIRLELDMIRSKHIKQTNFQSYSEQRKKGKTEDPRIYRKALCTAKMYLPNDEQDILVRESEGDFPLILKVYNQLPSSDLLTIDKEWAKYDHGFMEPTLSQCPVCEEYFSVLPQIRDEFFRPSISK